MMDPLFTVLCVLVGVLVGCMFIGINRTNERIDIVVEEFSKYREDVCKKLADTDKKIIRLSNRVKSIFDEDKEVE